MKFCFGLGSFQTLGGRGMVKGKFVLLSILAAALICWQFLPMNTNSASSGIVDPCSSEADFCAPGGTGCLMICPQGDGPILSDGGNEICVTVRDVNGNPIAGILATDLWLTGCTNLVLCGGSGSSNADAATDAAGQTQFSGGMAAGGCDTGLYVVVQGVVIGCPPTCLAIDVRSPDITADLIVDLSDFSLFAGDPGYPSPPDSYDPCMDYDCDGDIDLVDFSLFAQHWQHTC
jgi:hypothetical protein